MEMIGDVSLNIARVLVTKARRKSRATYEQVGQEIGWGHPNGRGLGNYLYELLHYCKAHGLPPLTTILVKKGERLPAAESMKYITQALGDINVEKAQLEVFAFDWSKVSEFAPPKQELPLGKPVWLTSLWGFSPESWGCIGFTEKRGLEFFLRQSDSETFLVAIYVTRNRGPEGMRGKVVGFYEITRQRGSVADFVAGDLLARLEAEGARGKWTYSLKASRAWSIIEEDWQPVETLFPKSYSVEKARYIGAQGVMIQPDEAEKLLSLTVYEVPVYGQTGKIDSVVTTMQEVVKPSKAVYPSQEPYWVGETDGPKHLYILHLTGDISAYLRRPPHELEGMQIIKVGFSRSPLGRRDQIQSAYPLGAYKWQVLHPKEIPADPPYPNAAVAIAGEDAMKRRLQEGECECLGGEFFLANETFVTLAWGAGIEASRKKMGK
jgi:hypothetical protein